MNDDLHSFIEPELEVRIVALVLGEASAFEKEELGRIIAERPEVAIWKRRIESIHGLVAGASQPAKSCDQQKWTLAEARREKILSAFKEGGAPSAMPERRISKAQRRALLALAACLVVAVIFVTLFSSRLKSTGEKSVSFMMDVEEADGEDRYDSLKSELTRPEVRSVIPDQAAHYGFIVTDESAKARLNLNSESALASIGDAMIPNEIAPPQPARTQEKMNFYFRSDPPTKEIESAGITTRSVLVKTRDGGLQKDMAILADPPATPGADHNLGDLNQSDFAITQTTSDGISLGFPLIEELEKKVRPDQQQEMNPKFEKLRERKLAEGVDSEGFYERSAHIPELPTAGNRGGELAKKEGGFAGKTQTSLRSAGEGKSRNFGITTESITGGGLGGGAMDDLASLPALGLEKESLQLKREKNSSAPFAAPEQKAKKGVDWAKKNGVVSEQQKLAETRGITGISSGKSIEIPTSDDIVFSDDSSSETSTKPAGGGVANQWNVESSDFDQDGFVNSEEFVAESIDSSRGTARKSRRQGSNGGGGGGSLHAVDPFADASARDESVRSVSRKLSEIVIPEINLEDATIEEARDLLSKEAAKHDPTALNGLGGVNLSTHEYKDAEEAGIGISTGVENTKRKEEEVREKAVKKAQQELRNNFETLVARKSDSTFSLNVSDVSFKLAKSALAEGRWPDASKVRPEEFVNALDYGDTKPNQAEKVSCVIEQGSHPFMQQRSLMRVALSTAALGRNASTPLRLTILLDRSGSMERNDRAESVRRAFDLLAAQLTPADEVTLVGFARTPRLLAERVKGDQCAKLSQIVNNTPTEGGTNLEEALTVGLQLAKQQFLDNAQNRIILLTDGAANLGDALPETLSKEVEKMRRAGVAFDACGVGADGFNDDILSALTKQGDGRYYFLDRPEDADEGFARQIAGALRPSAKNVKVQVIFNPDRVERYKLYGFEKHQLKKEDFRNDSVDAAEMAAEESGVAMYHYQAMPQGRGDVGTVSVRFQDVGSGKMIERTWNIPYEPSMADFSQATPSLQLAGSAALFGERLKGSVVGERVDLGELRRSASGIRGTFGGQRRFEELRTMLEQASR